MLLIDSFDSFASLAFGARHNLNALHVFLNELLQEFVQVGNKGGESKLWQCANFQLAHGGKINVLSTIQQRHDHGHVGQIAAATNEETRKQDLIDLEGQLKQIFLPFRGQNVGIVDGESIGRQVGVRVPTDGVRGIVLLLFARHNGHLIVTNLIAIMLQLHSGGLVRIIGILLHGVRHLLDPLVIVIGVVLPFLALLLRDEQTLPPVPTRCGLLQGLIAENSGVGQARKGKALIQFVRQRHALQRQSVGTGQAREQLGSQQVPQLLRRGLPVILKFIILLLFEVAIHPDADQNGAGQKDENQNGPQGPHGKGLFFGQTTQQETAAVVVVVVTAVVGRVIFDFLFVGCLFGNGAGQIVVVIIIIIHRSVVPTAFIVKDFSVTSLFLRLPQVFLLHHG
mmetsp:Transcript_2360/g.4828  ORF Transcript_2360/g.4828 Transcript_2360/m.4828 type:complete len:396 (-) Transcript_2360:36-1223(-)